MTIVVTPAELAIRNGWDEPHRFEWPGTVINIVQKTGKTCLQYVIWDRDANAYTIKCWDHRYLQTHNLEEAEWNFMDIGTWQSAIAEASLRLGTSSNNYEKVAPSSNESHGKRTKKRKWRART